MKLGKYIAQATTVLNYHRLSILKPKKSTQYLYNASWPRLSILPRYRIQGGSLSPKQEQEEQEEQDNTYRLK